MKPILALHNYMKEHFPRTLRDEVLCTCGAGNHVRILFFRVNGQPTTAIVPEGLDLTPEQFGGVIGMHHVEPMTESELETSFADSELGHMLPFENPFGSAVYFDETLLSWKELVFCPRMFFGQRGECFRAPTREFLELSRAIVLPLGGSPAVESEQDAWAV